jgi:DNA polymerase III epsilon subunit-like protein
MIYVVFDIETKNLFRDVGRSDPALLDISVVCTYNSDTNEYRSFLEEEFSELWPIIESADLLVGYNSDHFDIPLLNKYYPGDLTRIKSLDLLKEIQGVLGKRIRLDAVAEATLGKNKGGHGLDAVRWWKEGKIDEIRKYCIEDVRITKEVYEYALENHSIKFKDLGKIREIPLDTSKWNEEANAASAITHTLPF